MKILIYALTALSLLCSPKSSATLILDNFSLTNGNLSFDASGTVDKLGADYSNQLLIGMVESDADWINSIDWGLSNITENTDNDRSILVSYDLGSPTDLITTVGEDWQLGDTLDLTFDIFGDFNVAAFDISMFGITAGLDFNLPDLIQSEYNLVSEVNLYKESATNGNAGAVNVSEPWSLSVFFFAIALMSQRKRFNKPTHLAS